jgi:hypothetical protein
MEAVATTGAHGLSIDNNSLQGMLKDEVKIAFDNATGNEIFARKYKVEKFEGRVRCIAKRCIASFQRIHSLRSHCMDVHDISFSMRDEFILNIKLEQRQRNVFDMSSEDARSIKYLPEAVSVSNDCAKAAGIIEESSFSKDNNDLQYRLKDEVINAFKNYIDDNHYGGKYKVEKVEGRVRCIAKGCIASFQHIHSLRHHCMNVHDISFSMRGEFILNIKLEQRQRNVFDMSSEDARSIKYLPEAVSVSNDCAKAAGIIEESSFSKDNNDLQYRLKDEVINAFKNYIDDNHYGGKYKVSIVDNEYECIIKGCDRSYGVIPSLQNHCLDDHNIRLIFTGKYIIAIEKVKKDNTNATKTTTDNMDSNRKRSHSPDIHEEESNAKKAMLNPSESGYLQSALSRSNYNLEPLSWHDDLLSITEYNSVDDTLVTGNNDLISNDCEESSDFGYRFLESVIADDSFATPTAGNIDSINTNSNSSATTSSISNDCEESSDFGDRFLDSITADSFVIPTVSDNAPINTDSQSYATPIVISDDNVTSFSWCDDYSSR